MDHPVTPERWGTEEVKPLVSPDYCRGWVSRQWYRRGEPTQRGLPELRQLDLSPGEIKEARVHRSEHQRGEKQTDGELQRSAKHHAWVFSWELYAYHETLQDWERTTQKDWKQQSLRLTESLESFLFPSTKAEDLGSRWNSQEGFASVLGQS